MYLLFICISVGYWLSIFRVALLFPMIGYQLTFEELFSRTVLNFIFPLNDLSARLLPLHVNHQNATC